MTAAHEPHPAKAAGLDVTETDDGLVVLHEATGRVCHLNPTAAVVFELANGARGAEEIAAGVAQVFELAEAPVADVADALDRLREEGLLVG